MAFSSRLATSATGFLMALTACAGDSPNALVQAMAAPREVVDLGALVTADLPERVWGKGLLLAFDFTRPNSFDIVNWTFGQGDDSVSGSNGYYTLFNHGGPHIDAPNHVSVGRGLDSYPISTFAGPLKVFDVRQFPLGRSIPVDVFSGGVSAGDVVLIYTGYTPPPDDEAFPETIALTRAASEYLAGVPVRAFGTDAFSVAALQDQSVVEAESPTARIVPIHHSFLSRGIPVYEQLFNLDRLLGHENMFFVGVPLNIENGDGMIVRPVVFVY